MAVEPDLLAGTITLTNGSVDFTGTGTSFQLSGVRRGDEFLQIEGQTQWQAMVDTITSNTAGTLVRPWGGATGTYEYRLRYQPDGSRVTAQARNLIELLGNGRLLAIAGAPEPAGVIEILPGGAAQLVPKTSLVSGADYDVQVANPAARAPYDAQLEGFSVLTSNMGDGRAAITSRVTATAGVWSDPAYVTGPAITLDITEVDEVPYGVPPDVTLTPVAGGYTLKFDIPAGMIIEPGTTTTLASDQDAEVTFVPITGGYRIDIAIPRGPTGDIAGVTTFWQGRITNDANASAALTGLGFSAFAKTLIDDANGAAALTTLGVSAFAQTLLDDTTSSAARTTLGAQAALGFTPINKAGDTGVGSLTLANNTIFNFPATVPDGTVRTNLNGYGTLRGFGMVCKAGWDADAYPLIFQNAAGTIVGSISQTASVTGYNTSSDYRLKFDVTPLITFEMSEDMFDLLGPALLRIMLLNPVRHKWLIDPEAPETHGFIAHEAQAIVPHAVYGEKDAVEDIGVAVRAAYIIPGELIAPADPEADQDAVFAADVEVPESRIEDIRQGEAPQDYIWTKTGERVKPQGIDTSKLVPDLTAAVQELTMLVVAERQKRLILEARLDAAGL